MKPGYRIEYINNDNYVITPTSFVAHSMSKKQMIKFIEKLNKLFEELK